MEKIFNLACRSRSSCYQLKKFYKYTFPYGFGVKDVVEYASNICDFNDVHKICSKLRDEYSFNKFELMAFLPSENNQVFTYYMNDLRDEWCKFYDNNNLFFSDCTVAHAFNSVTPIIFKEGVPNGADNDRFLGRIENKEARFLEISKEFNYSKITCIPFHAGSLGHGIIRFYNERKSETSIIESRFEYAKLADLFFYSKLIFEKVLSILNNDFKCKTDSLTKRELEVLHWVASGKSNYAISDVLNISENTVSKHMKNIHAKLNVRSRQHAVAKAISAGILSL